MFDFLTPGALGIGGAILAVLLVVIIVVKRYRIVDPDTAMIVVGNKGKRQVDEKGGVSYDLTGQKVITGGGAFIWPFIQKAYDISLRSRRLDLSTTGQTKNGITIKAQAVAVIKVGGTEEMIRAAAQRFLSQQDQIERSAQEVLSGSLRSIIGSLTVQTIIQDRQEVASNVLSAAEEALEKQGLVIDTLQIQEISDDGSYIEDIGRPEAASVRQNAEIADTNANRASQEAKIEADKIIIDKNRELKLKQAAVQEETDKAAAVAEAAKPLEAAEQQKQIIARQAEVAKTQAALKEQELSASVRKVADADAYKVKTLAEAQKEAAIAQAEAEKQTRLLSAEATEREGQAEGAAISAKGEAEGRAIEARGKAFEQQSQAILTQQLIEQLPVVVERLANAYASIGNMTVIDTGGDDKVSGGVIGNMTSIFEMLKQTTGIDLSAVVSGSATGRAIGDGLSKGVGAVAENLVKSPSSAVGEAAEDIADAEVKAQRARVQAQQTAQDAQTSKSDVISE